MTQQSIRVWTPPLERRVGQATPDREGRTDEKTLDSNTLSGLEGKVKQWTSEVIRATTDLRMKAIEAQRSFFTRQESESSETSDDSGLEKSLKQENQDLRARIERLEKQAHQKERQPDQRSKDLAPLEEVKRLAERRARDGLEGAWGQASGDRLERVATAAIIPGIDMQFWPEAHRSFGMEEPTAFWEERNRRPGKYKEWKRIEPRWFLDPQSATLKLTNEATILAFEKNARWKRASKLPTKWYYLSDFDADAWLTLDSAKKLGFEGKVSKQNSPKLTPDLRGRGRGRRYRQRRENRTAEAVPEPWWKRAADGRRSERSIDGREPSYWPDVDGPPREKPRRGAPRMRGRQGGYGRGTGRPGDRRCVFGKWQPRQARRRDEEQVGTGREKGSRSPANSSPTVKKQESGRARRGEAIGSVQDRLGPETEHPATRKDLGAQDSDSDREEKTRTKFTSEKDN